MYTEEQLAALAAGATLESLGLKEPTAEELAAQETARVAAEAETARLAAEEAAKPVATELTTFLQTQLAGANADLLAAKVEAQTVTKELTTLKASVEGLASIARASIGHMSMNLGGSATAGEGVSVENLAAEHTRMSEKFKAKFKVGGIANTKTDVEKPAAVVDPMFMHAVKSLNK